MDNVKSLVDRVLWVLGLRQKCRRQLVWWALRRFVL